MRNTILHRPMSLLLLFVFFPICVFAQTITVKGVVKDARGEALPGVNIVESGTKTGTITSVDGRYQIKVSGQSNLTFSFIGFQSQTVAVKGRTQVDVVLQEDKKTLEEVVVVGYGNQRKEAVTGSVASIKGDMIREVPASNISQALQGRVAGVQMAQTSSKPGAAMQIRIRGTRSLNASNDPLVVLDGIPFAGSISDINPSDIKSIDILKDASATAIYGSRGANGVILVSTNKGYKDTKAKLTYNGYMGVKTLFARYPMMNGAEFTELRKVANKFTQYGVDEKDGVDTDWQGMMFENGIVTNHDMSIAGGTDKGNYNFGVGYYRDEAVIPGQNYNRYSLRASLDQELGQYIKVGISTNNNYSISNGSNMGIYNTLSATPIANPYNEDGSLKRVVKMANDNQWVYSRETVKNLGDAWIDQSKAFGSYNTLYGEVKVPGVKGLKYRANLGLNYRISNSGSYTGQGVFSENEKTLSSASVTNALTTNWAIENLLTYDRTFAEKHQLNVVAMYSAEESRYNSSNVSALDMPADYFQFYNLGQANGEKTVNPAYQGYNVTGLTSYMGRAMYSYDDRYMLSATFRSDASSRLAPGHQWHTYPAVSAGWNIKNESFMKDVEFINSLKVRVGYGETSNQSVEPYKTLGLLGTTPYNFGNTYTTGYNISELPNTELGWEYSRTWNYGLDFAFLKHRLTGTLEYYVQNTHDVLLSVGLPPTAGVPSYMDNIGKTQNKGIELSLNGVILDNHNGWTWEAGLNLYANRNKLVALSGGQEDKANWWFVGHPIDVIYDYQKVGLWNESDADYKYLQKLEPGGNAGMIKVKYTGGYNEDGTPKRQVNDDDRQIMDLNPDFEGGFNTRVAYKGFDLSIVGAFKRGGTLISTLYSSAGYLNMLSGRRGNVKVDYWTPENTDAKYPKPGGIESSNNPKYGSTLGYFDASYLKIRTITLGYDFNKKLLKNTGIEKVRIYCTVQNPFVLFSPYKKESGMDPETNSYGNENAAVAYSSNLKRLLTIGTNTPSTRNYLIGLNLTF